MDPLHLLLVEDEPPSRARLRGLAEASGAEVVAEAASVPEARAALAAHRAGTLRIDAVLLDVELPGESGLALVPDLPPGVHVVFVTAYAAYALDAFDEGAVDFVVKPVEAARLARALERVRHRLEQRAPPPDAASLARLAAALRPPEPLPTSIPSRRGDAVTFVPLGAITHFEARDKVVLAHTADGRAHVVEPTLTALAARLDGPFVQVSRSHVVARAHLAGVERLGGGRYALRLSGGARVTSGPTFADAVAALVRW